MESDFYFPLCLFTNANQSMIHVKYPNHCPRPLNFEFLVIVVDVGAVGCAGVDTRKSNGISFLIFEALELATDLYSVSYFYFFVFERK